jgi:hypothetical protein
MANKKKEDRIAALEQKKEQIAKKLAEARRKQDEISQAALQVRIQHLGKAMIKGGIMKKTDAEILQMLGLTPPAKTPSKIGEEEVKE